MAVGKEKSWFVYDLAALDRAWSDFTVGELIDKVTHRELLDAGLAEEARSLSKGSSQVRWLGSAYLGTYKNLKEAQAVQTRLDRELVDTLIFLSNAGAKERSLWEFYSSRGFFDRWFSSIPGEIDLDYALLGHVTYTGVRFHERNFHGILFGPCKDKNLLRRNLVGGNVMEVPPIEEIGYDPACHDAILTITEEYLRERVTRSDLGDEAWALVNALQKSIRFSREKRLPTYITTENELTIAPDFSFSDRQGLHRKKPQPKA